VKARYDLYREAKEWGRAKTFYEVGADYMFTKNLQINLEYARVNDRSLEKSDYNMVDVELDFRF
jgi:predicted porin